jgi:hypothetical protein
VITSSTGPALLALAEIKHTVTRAEQWLQIVGAEQNGDPEFSWSDFASSTTSRW